MATVMQNSAVGTDVYLMKVSGRYAPRMGQFCMLRGWEDYPLLSRPISVFDCDAEGIRFLYKVVGEGTARLSRLRTGDPVEVQGPYGNGFPEATGRVALVGGGIGSAPLYYAAKCLRGAGASVDLYLGFTDEALLTETYRAVCDRLTVDVGGYITDAVDPAQYDTIMTCGPQIMMRVLAQKCRGTAAELYVSMENRMGCGIGACLVCSCKTRGGNRKVCKDGPVFRAEEVFFDAE